MLIFGFTKNLCLWAKRQLGIEEDFGPCYAIGVGRAGKIVAVAVYNQYNRTSIQVTFVSSTPRWASKEAISGILRYPFIDLECKRITAVTGATNQPAREFLCRLGFKQEGYHPDALPSGDAVTYGLLRADAAKWTEGNYGQSTISAKAS